MTSGFLGALPAFVATALSAAAAVVRDGRSGIHAGIVPALVSSVLVPQMLPRVGATIRRVLHAAPPAWLGHAPRAVETDLYTDAVTELAHKNARLARELSDLRSAYAELQLDAAQRAATVDRLHHLAHHDSLTGLPNRVLLMERLESALGLANRAGSGVLVVYLDLNNFKTINDTLGHAAGDRILAEVGSRLTGCLRSSDTASRVGGDEFVLVVATTDAAADAPRIKARLTAALAAPLDVDGTPVPTRASIGMSAFPADGRSAMELIKKADRAMFGAKHSSRR